MKPTNLLVGVAFAALTNAAQAADFSCDQDGRSFTLENDKQQKAFITTFESATGTKETVHPKRTVYVLNAAGANTTAPAIDMEATATARADQKKKLVAAGQLFCDKGLTP